METKLQIFISSTYRDLIPERQAAVEAILKAGHIPAGMELFTANDKSQLDVIKKWIDESDVYILILGGRYGSIEPESQLSYTEVEYDHAMQAGKPHFAIVMSESRCEKLDPDCIEKESPEKLASFREKALSKMSSFFYDPKDVKICILEALPGIIEERKLEGWIRADKVPNTTSLTEEIIKLSEEKRALKKTADEYKARLESAHNSKHEEEKEFQEIIDVLSKQEVKTDSLPSVISDNASHSITNMLDLVYAVKKYLPAGIMSYGHLDSWIFHHICPTLYPYSLLEIQDRKIGTAHCRRYDLTSKGKLFLVFLDKQFLRDKNAIS